MEHLSKQLERIDLTLAQTNSLEILKSKLEPSESKVLEMKYAGKPFGKMDEEERWFSAQTMILKIHAITGWTIPVSEMMDILVDQFQKKLQEGYANVNIQEMEYAFRNRGIDIKDWGKSMNLSLLDEVMIPYLQARREISNLEESKHRPMMIENTAPLTEDEMQEWLEDWISKDRYDMDLLPLSFYDHLVKTMRINLTTQEKWAYTEKATTQVKVKLHEDMGICKTTNAYLAFAEFQKMEQEGFAGEMKGRILNRAKRLIIQDYITSVKNVQ